MHSQLYALRVACDHGQSEQAAAITLGFTQLTWDNLSGKEQLPWTSIKHWESLTINEKIAASALGYNETIWDNWSKTHRPPATMSKDWAKLTACANGENPRVLMVVK